MNTIKRALAAVSALALGASLAVGVAVPATAASACTISYAATVNTYQARTFLVKGPQCNAQGTRAKFTPPGGSTSYTQYSYSASNHTYLGQAVWSVTSPSTPNWYVATGGHARWFYNSAQQNYYF